MGTIVDASYAKDYAGYPMISMVYEGLPIRIFTGQKFLDYDVVNVNDDAFETRLLYHPPEQDPMLLDLPGFVRDPQLADMVREFIKAANSGKYRTGKIVKPDPFQGAEAEA